MLEDITIEKLRAMGRKERASLAEELRGVILETVSRNSGHLASNLGVVELTMALHIAFESPRDSLVWDVGHQAYVHKLLTGRYERFHTLRKASGLSGFPKRSESEHDVFDVGHSSTALSAALGLARAKEQRGEAGSVVAIVGDGALTGGMCYEALNDIGQSGKPLIVVLNDNEMSIAPNTGSISRYLAKLRANPRYWLVKNRVERFLRRVPFVGCALLGALDAAKNALRTVFTQGELFEALGLKYLGPFDGHDIDAMVSVFERAKRLDRPVLLHVITQKGRGYKFAEQQPDRFHGVAPFFTENGEQRHADGSIGRRMGSDLADMAEADPRIMAVTAAMPHGTGLLWFALRLPERYYDVGIAEEHAVTMAAGMAAGGLRPFVAVYSTFLQRAYDQIEHDVALQNLPVTFLIDRAGMGGEDGPTHHGVFDLSFLRPIPNLTLLAPRDYETLHAAMALAANLGSPVAIRYPKTLPDAIPAVKDAPCAIGVWPVVREGSGVVILAVGSMVEIALEAAEKIEAECGSRVRVIDAWSIKPLDEARLFEVRAETVLTVEDGVLAGGFGSAVLEWYAAQGLSADVSCMGIADAYAGQGSRSQLLRDAGLSAEGIAQRLLRKGKVKHAG